MKSHIRNQKMRLWDTPPPLLILCSQRCFLKPLGALTSPLYRGPCYRLCAHPVSPPCPSNEAVRLRVCGGYRMWTHKSPGRVRSGDLDGAGHPRSCGCVIHVHVLTLWNARRPCVLGAGIWKKGSPRSSRTLSEDWASLPALPAFIVNVNLPCKWYTVRQSALGSAQPEHPSLAASSPHEQTRRACVAHTETPCGVISTRHSHTHAVRVSFPAALFSHKITLTFAFTVLPS